MKVFSLVFFVTMFLSCSGEDPKPSPDSFCIFERNVSTNGGNQGADGWTFLRCDDNPNYQINNPTKYKGYQTTNCDCTKLP